LEAVDSDLKLKLTKYEWLIRWK